VYLMDGVYDQGLAPRNSGTPDAWITFQADQCALPILQGQGEGAVPDEDGNVPSGVWSSTGSYLRFVGIVPRYWDRGFGNGWTGEIGDNSQRALGNHQLHRRRQRAYLSRGFRKGGRN